jgi:predicted  nucleic acid-binding Zn-ribbon protein
MIATYAKLLADLERELTEAERDIERAERRLAERKEYREILRQGIDGLKHEMEAE